jgi:hypothetical protein
MSTGALIGIIIVVIVIAALVVAAVVATGALRRARLQRQFGPEYDRLVKARGRKKAEAELTERQRRVEALKIHELTPEQQASYSGDWAAIQERFVDTPAEAVGAAHTLIGSVMRDRGYPVDDRTASMDALAINHGRSFEGYRQTLGLRADSATTEQLREAMIRHRALFEDLTGLREGQGGAARDRVAEIRDRDADRRAVASDAPPAADREVADREPADRELVAENRDAAAPDRDLAAENPNRTADTPR